MNQNYYFRYLAILVCATILLQLPTVQSSFAESEESSPTIKIGWIGPITGSGAKWGSFQAAQIAVDEINAKGGIAGRRLQVIWEDGKAQGKDASLAAQKLLSVDKVSYILGGHCTPESLAIAPIVQRANAVMLASVTSNPLLTTAGDNVFRVTAISTKGTEAVFEYARKELPLKSVAVIYEEGDYPRPQAERFKSLALEHQISLVAYEGFLPHQVDFRTTLSRISNGKPDALYLATLSPDTAAILLKQIKELRLNVPILANENTGHAVSSSGQEKSSFEGVIFATSEYDPASPKSKEFIEKFLARYGGISLPYGVYTAESYDTVNLLSEIIEECGEKVDCAKKQLYATKNYDGASGYFSIDSNGDSVRKYQLLEVKDGKVVPTNPR